MDLDLGDVIVFYKLGYVFFNALCSGIVDFNILCILMQLKFIF
jgi:hypothetical protein